MSRQSGHDIPSSGSLSQSAVNRSSGAHSDPLGTSPLECRRICNVEYQSRPSVTISGTASGSSPLASAIARSHRKNAAELASALGGLKGPIMKVAQLLATIPEALPPEYITELTKLQSQAPPMGWAFVKRRMQQSHHP